MGKVATRHRSALSFDHPQLDGQIPMIYVANQNVS